VSAHVEVTGVETSASAAGFRLLLASPLVWALHFLASYLTAAIWCARASADAGVGAFETGMEVVRAAIAVYTLGALLALALVGRRGLREHRQVQGDTPQESDDRTERRRFIGFAAVLVSGLSAVAVTFVGLAAAFFGSCR
jgi:hypothetical protein